MMAAGNDLQREGFEGLGIRVGALEGDIGEVNDRLFGLDAKIDKAVSSLAQEFRTALSALATQLSERGRTPWSILIPAAAFLVTILGGVGWQALSPVREDVAAIKAVMVPRVEHDFRQEQQRERFDRIDRRITEMENRRYMELVRENERLRALVKQQP